MDKRWCILTVTNHVSGWTLKGAIQQFIDVYVSQATFSEVERSFPYMVAREFASGGGDVGGSQCSRNHLLTPHLSDS
jgi:hypothetical protein